MTTSGYTKRALKRPEGYPVGQPAPYMLLDCECGRTIRIDPKGEPDGICPCGIVYDRAGWILERPEVQARTTTR